MSNIKLKALRLVSKFLMKTTGNFLKRKQFSGLTYRVADFLVKNTLSDDKIFEIQGFKMKGGKTTRLPILMGDVEPSTTELIKREVKTGMIAFDLGANIGWFTLWLSKLVGEVGHVFSFEPNPDVFEVLKENVKLNKLSNVSVFCLAVSNKSGIAKYSLNPKQEAANRLESSTMTENTIDVETITLDEFCEKHNLKFDFIKMDIEGSEPKAFEGMKKSVSSNPKIKIVMEFLPSAINDVGSSPEDFINSLEQSGFIIKEIDEDKLGKLKSIKKDELLKIKNKRPNLYCYRTLKKL